MIFILRSLLTASIGAVLLVNAANADAWRHDEFLKLDLRQAMLSSKMLGPPTQFEAAPVEAKAIMEPEPVKANVIAAAPKARAARALVRPKLVPRSRVAGPRRNPLDAQASDTRIQVWPCRSGALCNWKR